MASTSDQQPAGTKALLLLPPLPSLGGLPLELFQLILNHLEGDQQWYVFRDLTLCCRAFHRLFTTNDGLRAQYGRARLASIQRYHMVMAAIQTSNFGGGVRFEWQV